MLNWLSMLLSEAPGEPSTRRVLAFAAFVFGVVLCFTGLWIPVSKEVEFIAITIITAAFGAMGIGRFAEAREREK